MYYASYLKSKGENISVIDLNQHYINLASLPNNLIQLGKWYNEHLEEFRILAEDEMRHLHPEMIVIPSHRSHDMCIWATYPYMSRDVAIWAKEISRVPIILVGRQSSYTATQLLRLVPQIDYVVLGHSEKTLYETVLKVREAESLLAVSNIAYRNGSQVMVNPLNFSGNIDDIPNPYYTHENFELKKYKQILERVRYTPGSAPGFESPGGILLTSRGCPYSCIFCDRELLWGKNTQSHSPEYIYETVKYCKEKFNIKFMLFTGPNFTLDRSRTIRTSELLKELEISWHCQTRADKVDLELLRIMKAGGCTSIHFGIESLSSSVLRDIGKSMTIEKLDQGLEAAKKSGIYTVGTIIVGLDYDSKEKLLLTAISAKKIVNHLSFNMPKAVRGTVLFERLKEKVPSNLWLTDEEGKFDDFFYTANCSFDELADLIFTSRNLVQGSPFRFHDGTEVYSLSSFIKKLEEISLLEIKSMFITDISLLEKWMSCFPFDTFQIYAKLKLLSFDTEEDRETAIKLLSNLSQFAVKLTPEDSFLADGKIVFRQNKAVC